MENEISVAGTIMPQAKSNKDSLTQTDSLSQITAEQDQPIQRINGKTLLDDLRDHLKKYLILQDGQWEAIVLWVMFSHCLNAFEIAPKLLINSPEKRCGKTTLMDLLQGLVYEPLLSSNITAASMFRMIDSVGCTIMIDEADTFDPPPIKESISGVSPGRLWTILRSFVNGTEAVYGGADYRFSAAG